MRIQNILMYFALVGLFSTSSVLFFACLGRDFALVTENLRRKVGKFGFAVFVSFALVCTNLAQKATTNAPIDNLSVSFPLSGMSSCSMGDSQLRDVPDLTVTNSLVINGFSYSNGLTNISFAWPQSELLPPYIDILANYSLTNQAWSIVDVIPIEQLGADTNANRTINWAEAFTNQIAIGAFPTNAALSASFFTARWDFDHDGDGMPDAWEIEQGYDPTAFGEELDSDSDGLPDRLESLLGTNPSNSDTDGDGIDDGDEYYGGTNPLSVDTDGDGILDNEERDWGTDPNDPETYETGIDEDTNVVVVVQLNATEPSQIFTNQQETTAATGPDYEMLGQYNVQIQYHGACTDSFSVLGVSPMGGSTTRGATPLTDWYDVDGPGWRNAFTLTASGARFKPLKTGYYYFQACADDSVNVTIGNASRQVQFGAEYASANPGAEASALFIAGQEYPVNISAGSIGGPAQLSFPVWGRFEPVLRPQLAAQFSKEAIIFEEAYKNLPRQRGIPKRSTKAGLSIGVRGGDLGGTLHISTENAGCLSFFSGDDCLSGNYSINPGETRYFSGVYIGARPSSAQDDVRVVLTFIENETGLITTCTKTITVVQIELTPENQAPNEAHRHRHIFGVGEQVYCRHYPESIPVDWGDLDGVVNFYGDYFICPTVIPPECSSLGMSIEACALGVNFISYFTVCRPRIVVKNPRVNIRGEGVGKFGKAGCLALYLDLYVAPFFVSFKGMAVQEIPDESQAGNHGGYYDDQTKGGSWSHTAFNGAGNWCEVDANGQYGTDCAGTSREYEQPWIDGYNEWSIPMAYGWGGVSAAIILPDPPTTQRFEIDAKGTFSIKKFGHNARRNRWGLVWLDGKMTL